MAEEKETKKTTTKKETVKEVKSEKRFCPNCGKELKEGEKCSCVSETITSTNEVINTDAIVNTGKGVLNTIINVFKKPDKTIKSEIEKKESTNSIIIIIALAISFAFYLMATISTTVNAALDATLGLITKDAIDIPYFKVFVYGILIYALISVIPMFAAFIIGKITRNNGFTFKKAFKLYTTSNAPLVFAFLIMAVVLLIDVKLLTIIGFIGLAIISIFCFFNFILGFDKETEIRDDRRSWALTSILVIWVAIEILAIFLIAGSAVGDLTDFDLTKQENNYNNSFNW